MEAIALNKTQIQFFEMLKERTDAIERETEERKILLEKMFPIGQLVRPSIKGNRNIGIITQIMPDGQTFELVPITLDGAITPREIKFNEMIPLTRQQADKIFTELKGAE